MIVCHCNVLTVEDIQGAVDELLTEMPLRVITPGLVYRRLGTRGRCCGCFPLAIDIIKERLALVAPNTFDELKFDLIGCNSLYWNPDYKYNEEPSEVRVRVAGRAKTKADADIIGNEVEALYTNGPAGGCGPFRT